MQQSWISGFKLKLIFCPPYCVVLDIIVLFSACLSLMTVRFMRRLIFAQSTLKRVCTHCCLIVR